MLTLLVLCSLTFAQQAAAQLELALEHVPQEGLRRAARVEARGAVEVDRGAALAQDLLEEGVGDATEGAVLPELVAGVAGQLREGLELAPALAVDAHEALALASVDRRHVAVGDLAESVADPVGVEGGLVVRALRLAGGVVELLPRRVSRHVLRTLPSGKKDATSTAYSMPGSTAIVVARIASIESDGLGTRKVGG